LIRVLRIVRVAGPRSQPHDVATDQAAAMANHKLFTKISSKQDGVIHGVDDGDHHPS
jgi:hypothetical protein